MTADDFRRLALAMPDAIESAHMGHPDFRVNNRIFASLHHDRASGMVGMVKLTPEQQEQFIQDDPDTFSPEAGAWGRAGCTKVRLASADEETVGEALTLAWQNILKTPRSKTRRPAKPRKQTRKR